MKKIYALVGEHTCKKIGGTNNFNTRGSIIRIDAEEDSRFYLVSYLGLVGEIQPVDMTEAIEISWFDVDIAVRQRYYKDTFPNISEEEYNIGVYGEEEGTRINEENKWADEHLVFSREITLKIKKELGEFSKVIHLNFKSTSDAVTHKYCIDDKWLVTITFDDKTVDVIGAYTIKPISIRNRDKFFKRIGMLIKEANVPWFVAYSVGHFEDKEVALSILEQMKDAKSKATEELKKYFFDEKVDADTVINELLDKRVINCIELPNDKHKTGVANFLVS